MMPAARATPPMINRLPPVRGRLTPGAALGPLTWFRTGGAAEVLFRPADVEDLAGFLGDLDPAVAVTVIGAGSNMIVRDGGIEGIVIRLPPAFARITVEADGIVAGGAALDLTVAETAADAGRDGLAFLSGIPGTIGGAVAMNAGAYGGETGAVTDWVELVTREGWCGRRDDIAFAYRRSDMPEGAIVTAARLLAPAGDPAAIAERMAAIRTAREATQPVRARTGGSTFKNPDQGPKAWELIDRAGCRGLTRGAAQVSEKHCNFLLNLGGATAADIEGLGEEVRRRVLAETGVMLEWEIRRIGRPLPGVSEAGR